MLNKKRVLFVGSFKEFSKDGSVGGQMYACKSLINSKLSDSVVWILIDSTADSNVPENFIKRCYKAIKRLILFIYYLLSKKVDVTLIFSADGWSFIEKGSMALIAKFINKKVIIAPRSGLVVNDIKESRFMRKFIPYVLNHVDYIICQGETWKRFYSSLININSNKFIIINNWIDIDKYNSSKIKNKNIHILYLAWVDKNKGIFDLIKALKFLNFTNYILNVAGDGDAMLECKKLVSNLGITKKVNFLSWVVGEAKIKLLSKSDIFVLPSYFEGYPNSLIEAMASSCAVIATDVGSIPDLIIDKKNGLIFKPGDINVLANHLDLLLTNSNYRTNLALCGRYSVVSNNTTDIAADKFKSLIY